MSISAGRGLSKRGAAKLGKVGVEGARSIPYTGKRTLKDKNEFFLERVQLCRVTYDYSDKHRDAKAKAERLMALQELCKFASDTRNMTGCVFQHLDIAMDMIQTNIFRPLSTDKRSEKQLEVSDTGVEEGEILIDPAWPHLEGVYEFFYTLLLSDSVDARSSEMFISPSFIQKFLGLFESEEPREREHLKNSLHLLYAKFIPKRKMIRKAINDRFLTMIHESQHYPGTSELLDILVPIISEFTVPVRAEHVFFFKSVIIPLHKVETSHLYQEQLVRGSMLFLSKDRTLALPFAEGLLRYWPLGNSSKEVMFLNELREALEVCEISALGALINKLFKRIVRCLSGPHLQVADQALCFFESDGVLEIVRSYKQITFSMIVPVIVDLAETHWHQ